MPAAIFSKKEGFTLIETVVSLVLISLLIAVTVVVFKNQAISTHQIGEAAEMEDNLRTAAYWLTKDIREAAEVAKAGSGVGKDNALVLKKSDNDYISYFYGTTSRPNTFYRGMGISDNVNNHTLQPLTNEYLFGGTSKGYVRGWEIKYYKSDGTPPSKPEEVRLVKFIKFTLYGSYGGRDDPAEYKRVGSSVSIRATP